MKRTDTAPLFLLAFTVYLWTAAPGVSWFDTGELAVGAFTLGNGHPPGQPLYALLGRAATQLPLGAIPYRLVLLSALFGAGVVALLPHLLERVCRLAGVPAPHPVVACIFLPGVGLALPLWLQAVRIEVYTLHLFTLILLLGMALELRIRGSMPPGSEPPLPVAEPGRRPASPAGRLTSPGLFLSLCLLTGLGLANHHLLIFMALPGLALLIGWPGLRRGAHGVAAMGLGLAVYLQAPLRSHAHALLDWGRPARWSRWWEVVTGRAYQRSFTHLTSAQLIDNLDLHGRLVLVLLGLPILLLAVLGLLRLRRAPRTAAALLLLIGGNTATTALQGLFSAENPDALGYLCLSFLLLGLLAALGLDGALKAWLERSLERGIRPILPVTAGAAASLVLGTSPAFNAWPRPDLHDDWLSERFGQQLLRSLPAGALYLSGSDATTFATWYQQVIGGARPDITPLAVYTLAGSSPLRSGDPPMVGPDTTLSDRGALDRIFDHEAARRAVSMTANDLPLARAERLRADLMTFRVIPNGQHGPALDAGLDALETRWKPEIAERLTHRSWLADRQARLLFPAHLEALGDHFRALGLLTAADRMFALAEAQDPDPSRLVRLKRAQLQERRRRLEAGLLTPPGLSPALCALEIDIALGRRAEANARLDGLEGSERNLARARLAWLDGDLEAAARELRQIRLTAPVGPVARAGLLELQHLLQASEAEPWLREIIPVQRDPALLVALGRRRLEAGAPDEAGRLLDAAVKLEPGAVPAHTARAWCRLEVGRPLEAFEDVRFALEIDPVDPEALRLSSYLYRQGVR